MDPACELFGQVPELSPTVVPATLEIQTTSDLAQSEMAASWPPWSPVEELTAKLVSPTEIPLVKYTDWALRKVE